MKIYAVAQGDYSDYRIEAMFTDLEKAKDYCRLNNPGAEDGYGEFDSGKGYAYTPDFRIEEYDTDPEVPTVPKDLFGFNVFMSRDGETAVVHTHSIITAQRYRHKISFVKPRQGRTSFYDRSNAEEQRLNEVEYMQTMVLARDKAHAIKIASEKRAQILALGRWPADTEYDRYGKVQIEDEKEKENG